MLPTSLTTSELRHVTGFSKPALVELEQHERAEPKLNPAIEMVGTDTKRISGQRVGEMHYDQSYWFEGRIKSDFGATSRRWDRYYTIKEGDMTACL